MGESLRKTTDEMLSTVARFSDVFTSRGTRSETVTLGKLQFDAFFITTDGPRMEFFFLDNNGERFGNFDRLRNYLQAEGKRMRFATNAGIFLRVSNPTEFQPEGLFVQGGKEIVPLNTRRGEGNFYMQPNGVFVVAGDGYSITETRDYINRPPNLEFATQSGPLLVHDGIINRSFSPGSEKMNIRSGVGTIDRNTAVFAISRAPVTFHQFATMFSKVLHCRNALYLDGAISEMYLPELGRLDSGGDFAGLIAVIEDEDAP
jgi:uncharacterized protein YigE (DUF2233 family)